MGKRVSEAIKQRILELNSKESLSHYEIARRLGISHSTVRRTILGINQVGEHLKYARWTSGKRELPEWLRD